MDIKSTNKKIIIYSSVFLIVLGGAVFTAQFFIKSNDEYLKRTSKVQSDTRDINNKIAELKKRSLEVKKYSSLWKEIPENIKEIEAIKISEINNLLDETAKKYHISNQFIKINLPQAINSGSFKHKTISVSASEVTITFKSIDDTKAILFINEFLSKIPGYKIIDKLNITKTKEYTEKDYVEISLGKNSEVSTVVGSISFTWYSQKEK